MSKPVFIGGYFKSGTTLLRSMLSKHSNITSGLETYWFMLDPSNKKAFEKKILELSVYYDIPQQRIQEIAGNYTTRTDFLDKFMSLVLNNQSKKRWLEKTPGNVLHIEEIFSHWPDAQFIYIHRDPRDIFISMRQAGKISSIQNYANAWSRFAIAADKFAAKQKPENNAWYGLSYESLVLSSEIAIQGVLSFLQETWEESVAKHTGDMSEFDKVREMTGKESTTLLRTAMPITKSRIGLWQGLITPDELNTLETYMAEYGVLEIYRSQCYEAPG